jgi:arginase
MTVPNESKLQPSAVPPAAGATEVMSFPVHLIVVPYDSARRGERMGAGPEVLSRALEPRVREAGHPVHRVTIEAPSDAWRAEIRTAFDLARGVADAVRAARDAGAFPLVLSGNCGPAAVGCVATEGDPAVFWFDAHGDFNTPETTVGGFLDGMALATVTGGCWWHLAYSVTGFREVREDAVVLVGARDLDPLEAQALELSRIRRASGASLRPELAAEIGIVAQECAGAYVHLDLDVLDPSEGRMNSYAAPHGLSRDDVAWSLRAIKESFYVFAASVTAFDPACDPDGRALDTAIAMALTVIEFASEPELPEP